MKELNEKVYKIIGACMEVHRVLGPGLPVEFYQKSLEIEMAQKELKFEVQKAIDVTFKETVVGQLTLDFVVEDEVILVLRSQDQLHDTEVQQVLRCLSYIDSPMGVLVNLGQAKIQYKRILPSRQHGHSPNVHHNQPRDTRKESSYRSNAPRFTGRTRESNPIR